MNPFIARITAAGTAYAPRKNTDTLFAMLEGNFAFDGALDTAARHIGDTYLCNDATWKMFVGQFRRKTDTNGAWKCEYWGKMMRGAALTYQYTHSEKLYAALTDTVLDMLSTQDEHGAFTTYPDDMIFGGWDLWGRKYILLGMEHYMEICRDEALKQRVLTAICAHADEIIRHIGSGEGQISVLDAGGWSGLPATSVLEPIMRLYNITGEKRYLDFADYIVSCGGSSTDNIWELAYEDRLAPYQYKTTKAYEMMSCFEGLLEYYRVTGIEKYKQAAIRYAKRIMTSDISIIGCAGCFQELFDNGAKTQLDTGYGGLLQETCVTVTWIKFCYQLLQLTGDPAFADSIELAAYNGMLGAVNSYAVRDLNYGMPFDSYSPLLFSTRARLSGGFNFVDDTMYGCCACIGSAGTALSVLSAAMVSRDGVYVNLYMNGKVTAETPSGGKLMLCIDTDYPRGGNVKITVHLEKDEKMTVALRIPPFCHTSTVRVGSETLSENGKGYVTCERVWHDGDVIDLSLDVRVRTFRTEGVDENAKYHVALYKGPVVLARDARLGEPIDSVVDIDEDENGFVRELPSDTAKFPKMMEYKIPNRDGTCFTVIDYGSAGKTWARDSMLTAWLATKNYWEVDFGRTIMLASRNSENKRWFFIGEDNYLHGSLGTVASSAFKAEDAGDGYVRLRASCGKYITLAAETPYDDASMEPYTDSDDQLWQFVHVARNYYLLVHKRTRCTLYEHFGSWKYRLYATEPDSDKRFLSDVPNNNMPVNVLIEVVNAPWGL